MDEAQTIAAGDWRAAESDLAQDEPVRRGSLLDRLLGPMDREVANSFTEAQLQELERVLAASSSRRLPIDIRITLPALRRRYFLTVLAGPERRSAERLKLERAKHRLWTFWNVCTFVFLLVLFVPTFIGLVHIFASAG